MLKGLGFSSVDELDAVLWEIFRSWACSCVVFSFIVLWVGDSLFELLDMSSSSSCFWVG